MTLHIAIFSTTPYTFLTQRPQHLAKAFLRAGCNVAFINPINNLLSSTARAMARALLRTPGPTIHEGLDVVTIYQLQMPLIRMPLVPYNTRPEQIRQFLWRKLKKFRGRSGKHIAFLESPLWLPYVPRDMFEIVCYDCIDDFRLISGGKPEMHLPVQRATLASADAVFYTADRLRAELEPHVSPTTPLVKIPNAVDYEWFQTRAGIPARFRKRSSSSFTAGYVGAIYDWIDVDLLVRVAHEHPSITIVLVGPVSPGNRKLLAHAPANIIVAGVVPYGEVPARVADFDVCIIPFKDGPIAQTTDPIKLYEYFALGKPVVATPMHELRRFADAGVMTLARTPEEFSAALGASVEHDSPELFEQRRAIARTNSWDNRAAQILETLRGIDG